MATSVITQENEITTTNIEKNIKIFRYKLSDDILSIITQFAKIHQLDDRHSYKEAWKVWLNDNKERIAEETERLGELGYNGDVEEKMYIAGRYYFREKVKIKKNSSSSVAAATTNAINEQKNVKKTKRKYIVMGKNIIEAMDNHLSKNMKQKNFKPEFAYKNFCEQHVDLLRTEIRRLVNEEKHIFTDKDMNLKIKKTYKNRYFRLSSKSLPEGEDDAEGKA